MLLLSIILTMEFLFWTSFNMYPINWLASSVFSLNLTSYRWCLLFWGLHLAEPFLSLTSTDTTYAKLVPGFGTAWLWPQTFRPRNNIEHIWARLSIYFTRTVWPMPLSWGRMWFDCYNCRRIQNSCEFLHSFSYWSNYILSSI